MQSGPEQFRDWMRRRGFNQADAARYLEETEPVISNIATGGYSPGLRKAIHIEQLTGIPVEAWATELASTDDRQPAVAGKRKIAKA